MINVGPPMPVPNQSAANGTQATGAINLTPSNIGVMTSSKSRNQPIDKPKGMPTSAANPKPMPNRFKLAAMCSGKVAPANGLSMSSTSLNKTSCGIGKNCGGANCSPRAKYQKAKNPTVPVIVKLQKCCGLSSFFMWPLFLYAKA